MTDSTKIIVVDTETTGLKPGYDEVLSVSIVDGLGNVLFDDYVKPATRKRWPNAAKINGITWADVKDKPTLMERKDEIEAMFANAELVVGYNISFDLNMLKSCGLNVGSVKKFDVMTEYARALNGGRRVKLIECARHYGYEFAPHESLNDVLATLHCYDALIEDPAYTVRPVAAARPLEAEVGGSAGDAKGRSGYKTIGMVLIIASVMLFFNSCSLGGGLMGTLGIAALSVLMFFIGLFAWIWGQV